MAKTHWQNWVIAVLGAWLVISALFFGIDTSASATWNAIIVGLLLVAFTGWMIGVDHEILPKSKRAKGDLRAGLPELAVPDEHEHMAGLQAHTDTGPGIEAPDFHVQAPGETAKG